MLLPLLLAAAAQGPVPYSTTADWESYPGGVATGGAFADIDGDGFLDLVVANGNDILRQRVEVYLNDGAGGFPPTPSWQSADLDYHGHLSVGDVDQDGWPDVAVSVFLGPNGFGDRGRVKLYRNLGGALESTPSWQSADRFPTFSCDFGDADGDGDLDLAVAVGEPYYGSPEQCRVYFNQGGVLQATPGWLGPAGFAMDVAWGDADGDGDLDLAVCGARGPNQVFFQGPGGLAATPGWTSTDNNNQNGNSLAWRDLDGDGDQDLGVTDNNQLGGGQGVFKIYRNLGTGLATTPYWSDYGGMVSAIAFADLHLDGFADVAGGIWWGGTRIYPNDGGAIPAAPAWTSAKASVVEALFFGDLDNRALRTADLVLPPNGGRLFTPGPAPLHEVIGVQADGVVLPPNAWSADLEDGWIALDRTPQNQVVVRCTWSEELDLGVTNWDQSIGNLVFHRRPRVDLTATPTGPTTLGAGGTLAFDLDLESTTNRPEDPLIAIAAVPAAGNLRLLDLGRWPLTPFQHRTVPFAFPVPSSLPPGALGPWTLAAAVIEAGVPVEETSFPFTLQ
ncbi:MAG: VCBS repeat-containing protein [Planctomycetota bacterium]|nr:MAG: VCBS repeat-containing protein [Planctomycetota bacterium]